MEPLFKNKTVLSKENYMNLVEFHQKKNNWKYWSYTGIISILFVIAIAFQIANSDYLRILIISIFFVGFLLYRFINPYYKTVKEIQSDKVQKSLINYYFFYEKFFKIKNELGSSKIKYHKLYKVYENEDYFYLYLDKSNALIVKKSGFMIGNADSFEKFIKSKVWIKFKKD